MYVGQMAKVETSIAWSISANTCENDANANNLLFSNTFYFETNSDVMCHSFIILYVLLEEHHDALGRAH